MTVDPRRLPGHHEGIGAPLLLVHGLGTGWRTWAPMLPRLARHHEVSAVDLPGFGQSPPVADPTVAELADALEEHLDALGWQRCHVSGNSLGGLLALELARRQRTLTVTAFAPMGMAVGWEAAWSLAVLRTTDLLADGLGGCWVAMAHAGPVRDTALGLMLARPREVEEELATHVTSSFAHASSSGAVLDRLPQQTTTARLGEITCPVTIAWGTEDRIMLPRQGPRFRRAMPHARLVRLRGLGHVPMIDGPDVCCDVLLATLAT